MGVLMMQIGRFAEAEAYLRRASKVSPESDATFYNFGLVLKSLNRPSEALDAFSKALGLNPAVAETWNNRGTVLNALGRPDEAIGDFERATSLKPEYAEAFCNKGKPLIQQRRYVDALAAFDTALRLRPDLAEAWQGRGDVLAALGRDEDAIAAFVKATALKPDYAEAHSNAAKSLARLRRYDEAITAGEAALKADSEIEYALGDLLHAKAHICDWDGLTAGWADAIGKLRNGARVTSPFALLASAASASDHLTCSKIYAADRFLPIQTPVRRSALATHGRIRIGYLSSDFHEHPTAHLAAGLFEHHDRARFETLALSCGPNDGSPMRARLSAAFDRFIDVQRKSDPEAAALIRDLAIDIAVDLNGHTTGTRLGVLAQRPAPLQVSYLGYPGTLGTDFIDYIVADRIVIPPEQQEFYTEQIAYLPGSYQVNDASRRIADVAPTRAEVGLPADGFVFCSFNNAFKITPEIFDVWMRLLSAVDGSVLWLLEANASCAENLRSEARKRNVAPDRIVFAPRTTLADHLARHRLADLFLDTIHYGAHTTASDALWAGLPVLTCLGATFSGRVAASLLTAAGMPELIVTSLAEYEALALDLVRNPARLSELRAKLDRNRLSCPLFDTRLFTRQLEAAYQTMWQRHQRGEPPRTFAVGAAT